MDCARVTAEELAPRYLLGELEEADRAAFEEHFFACDGCFAELTRLRALQAELARAREQIVTHAAVRPRRWLWAVSAAAGLAIVAFAARQIVVAPPVPEPPRVWRGESHATLRLELHAAAPGQLALAWDAAPGARSYVVKVLTRDGAVALERATPETGVVIERASLPSTTSGSPLVVQVEAQDATGRTLAQSEPVLVQPPQE